MTVVERPYGIKIPYAVTGPSDGRRLVFAHSLTASGLDAPGFFRPLHDLGWQVAAMDQRGHGLASAIHDPARFALDEMGSDIVAVLDDLGWESAWFTGGSMGAATALAAAVSVPARVDGLGLMAPAFGRSPNVAREVFRSIGLAFGSGGTDAGIAAWVEAFPGLDPPPTLATMGAENLACLLGAVMSWTLGPALDVLPSFAVPVLVLAWSGDDIHPWAVAEEIVALARHGRLQQVGVGNPAELFTALAALLSDV